MSRITPLLFSFCLLCLASQVSAAENSERAAPPPAPAPPAKSDDANTKKEKAPANSISIDNFTFSPQSLTVTPGTTVVWVNRDDVPHTVRSVDNKFKSGTLDTDDTFKFTFNDEGTFKYFCTVHTHMTGEIIVKK